jgi:ATP-dependent helicase/nuclease subunit A
MWSEEQQQAIRARRTNLLVSAAAGAGKTAVLVERILHLVIADQVDIDAVLVVTFTNAAASELKTRLHQALLRGGDQNLLERQVKRLHLASICTIHAFGMEVIKQYYYFLDLDPNFKVMDEVEADLLQQEVMNEMMESWYEAEDGDFIQLALSLGESRGDQKLARLLLRLYHFTQTQAFPEQWLTQKLQSFQFGALTDTLWAEEAKRQAFVFLEGVADYFREARTRAAVDPDLTAYLPALDEDLACVETLRQAAEESWPAYCLGLQTVTFSTLPRSRKNADAALRKQVQDLRNKGKALLKEAAEQFSRSTEEVETDIRACAGPMTALGRCVTAFMRSYRQKKLERRRLDFDDLEHLALELLQRPDIAQEYRRRFQYIFVDEYQDSNAVQEAILNLIRREDNMFLVGDMKQSIYRFRAADPDLCLDKLTRYVPYADTENAVNQVIYLNRNYRSSKSVVAGVNYLFHHLMSLQLGDVAYDWRSRLYHADSAEEGEAVEWLLLRGSEEGEGVEHPAEELTDQQGEALLVAKRIQLLLQQDMWDEVLQTKRKIRCRDIVVLLRSVAGRSDIWADILHKQGIPVYHERGPVFLDTAEIRLFLDLLRLLDNRRQDIPFLAVMRSVIGGFSAEDLAAVRLASPRGSFYEAQLAYAQREDDLAARLRDFNQMLASWQRQVYMMPLEDFIWYLYQETGYDYYAAALPGGERREAHVRLLLQQARQFRMNAGVCVLTEFIRYVEQMQSIRPAGGSSKEAVAETEDVVRIMSVHKSKGLEFPVVIVAGLGRRFNLRDTQADVLMHKDLGLGGCYYDHRRRSVRVTLPQLLIRQKIRQEQLAEEMRIFYVACTRAKQKLILSGSVKSLSRSLQRWQLPLNPFHLSQVSSCLDWVGSVLIRHPDVDWADMEPLETRFDSRWLVQAHTLSELEYQDLDPAAYRVHARLDAWLQAPYAAVPCLAVERLNWRYPHEAAAKLPSKVTVTQLQNRQVFEHVLSGQNYVLEPPLFLQGKLAVNPLERGSVMHLVLKWIRVQEADTPAQVERQVLAMRERDILTAEEVKLVNCYQIARFFQSELGRRMRQSAQLFRETPFNLQLPACQAIASYPDARDTILVQGVIDVFFAEPEGWVLVDYKTDYVPDQDYAAVRTRYRGQVDLYAQALAALQPNPVKAKYLYLLQHQAIIEV